MRDLQSRDTTSVAHAKIESSQTGSSACLLRHEELQRTNALLRQQLAAVTHERDNLRSRLNAARSRIDVLLERLPRDPVRRRATRRRRAVRSAR